MQEVDQAVRELLSIKQRECFDDIVYQRVLGASKHIHMISDMMMDIATHAKENGMSPQDTVNGILRVSAFFITTRGEASQAIVNALRRMTRAIESENAWDFESILKTISESVEKYRRDATENLRLIDRCVKNTIEGMCDILVFDYSSTVARIATIAAESGTRLTCYVPESRALDGGKPYIIPFSTAGHNVRYLPDSAIYHYLRQCDAAFIGAETYYPDGTAFNTVGSELVGLLCREFCVPYYVITPLIKVDTRALYGYQRPHVMLDLLKRLNGSLSKAEKEAVDCAYPELISIPPDYIHAYITERGIIPPGNMFTVCLDYIESLEGQL